MGRDRYFIVLCRNAVIHKYCHSIDLDRFIYFMSRQGTVAFYSSNVSPLMHIALYREVVITFTLENFWSSLLMSSSILSLASTKFRHFMQTNKSSRINETFPCSDIMATVSESVKAYNACAF